MDVDKENMLDSKLPSYICQALIACTVETLHFLLFKKTWELVSGLLPLSLVQVILRIVSSLVCVETGKCHVLYIDEKKGSDSIETNRVI